MESKKKQNEGSDPFSNLPTPIFHHILSLLPSDFDRKEVARLSFVSKSWRHPCSSYPILDFCVGLEEDDSDKQQWDRFVGFVDYTMTRFREDNIGIQRFKLQAHNQLVNNIERSIHSLNTWISIAMDNLVRDLSVSLDHVRTHESLELICKIPTEVLSFESLNSLLLGHQVILEPAISCVYLPSLRSLEIDDAIVDNENFSRLLGGCPLIENLTVRSDLIREIVVSGLQHIKMINLYLPWSSHYKLKVKIEALILETLCLEYRRVDDYTDKNISIECPNLKCLKLIGRCLMSKEWFDGFLSNFPMLESIEISKFDMPKRIKFTNRMLKKVESGVGELKLSVSGLCSETYLVILDSLFATFRPTTLHVAFVENPGVEDSADFTKFLCENLASKGEDGECSCSDQVKCWKHQLKEVKIEGSEEHRPLEWFKLFELLPAMRVGNKIRFRLQWAT